MTANLRVSSPALPDRAAVERRLVNIFCERTNTPMRLLTLDADILSVLVADSLDVIELVMSIEEAFAITLPDEELSSFFKKKPFTVRNVAEVVLLRWGTGWRTPAFLPLPGAPPEPETLPFTQLGR